MPLDIIGGGGGTKINGFNILTAQGKDTQQTGGLGIDQLKIYSFMQGPGNYFYMDGANLYMCASYVIGWSNGADYTTAKDLGLARAAAGILSVTNASTAGGAISIPSNAVTLSGGANHNVAVTSGFARITGPGAVFNITGFSYNSAVQTNGTILQVFNAVAFAMTLTNESASSTAGNRITTLTGADVTLRAGTSFANFIYDGTTSRWILTGTN